MRLYSGEASGFSGRRINPGERVILDDWRRGQDGKAIAVIEGAHQPPFTGQARNKLHAGPSLNAKCV